MKKQGILIILISLLNLNFQVKEELSEEAIYSRILTEYLSEIIEEKNVKVLIKKELERKSLEEELTFEDLGYLHSISKNLVIIEDGIGRPDSIMVNMVNKFEKDESQHEIDFGKIELKHEVEYISKRKFLRKSKSKKEWRRISKKNPTSLILLEFSNQPTANSQQPTASKK